MQLTDNKEYLLKAMQEQALAQQMAAQQGGQSPTLTPQAQDLSGIPAQMQNISNQQAMQNAEMNKSEQLMNSAGQTQSANINPLALAAALGRSKERKSIDLANAQAKEWNERPAIEFYSKGLDPMKIKSDEDY